LANRAAELLQLLWSDIDVASIAGRASPACPSEIESDIDGLIGSNTKTYRYVLPTQLLAKLANPSVDCRCIQSKRGGPGAFDARSLAGKVVVPFDRRLESVLGGSTDPYVNNNLRCEEFSPAYRKDKKDKAGWDAICRVLDRVETAKDAELTRTVLLRVLLAIRRRLEETRITYPVPNRISLESTLAVLRKFLDDRSGGRRFEAVVAAAFQALGTTWQLFDSIRRSAVNSADQQSGASADVECLDAAGRVVMAVEAKDRAVTIRDVQDKLPMLRSEGIGEAFFLTTGGVDHGSGDAIRDLVAREFSSGQNLYVLESDRFFPGVLSILGEPGRREFLRVVGAQLDEFAEWYDRKAWAVLLAEQ